MGRSTGSLKKSFNNQPVEVALMSLASRCRPDELEQAEAALHALLPSTVCRFRLIDNGLLLKPKDRAEQLITLFEDPRCDVVWALRGGCGSADCLPELYRQLPRLRRSPPTLLIGFSDITALLLLVSQQLGWPVLHAPVARDVLSGRINDLSIQQLLNVLSGQDSIIEVPLQPLNDIAKVSAHYTAPITGGNLCMVTLSIKDYNEMNGSGHIIMLEDINEAPYAVARSLSYLSRIGQFDSACALVLGDFSGSDIDRALMDDVRLMFASCQSIPVFSCEGIGHGQWNTVMPFAVPAVIQMGLHAKLSWSIQDLYDAL